ncbi:MAG: hypothetical protein KFB95_06450 [Simkaniaceae bacterium]|nr:MAG: hypothetical protein KFB95_06450 [Simkaniaceae bacterium]
MKKYILSGAVALGIFLCVLTYVSCIMRTKGFSYKKIHSLYGYDSRWDFGLPSPEQAALLDRVSTQTFSPLGSGRECYAFVSEDGEIVVKFFKQKHMRTRYILDYLPLSEHIQMIRNETLNRHSHRRLSLYQSYQLAHERLQDHSGVLYLHLTKTNYLKKPITLFSSRGKKLVLKLDDMEFLIQKRAHHIFDVLSESPEKGKQTIDAILDYLTLRNERGIGDNDINCKRNLGVLDGKVIQIDIGELYPAISHSPNREELTAATLDLKDYLERNHPELVFYLELSIESHCR